MAPKNSGTAPAFYSKLLNDFHEWNLRMKGTFSEAEVLKLQPASGFPGGL